MSDLLDRINRLRHKGRAKISSAARARLCLEAGAEIERLRADRTQQQAEIELLKVRLENAEDDAARLRNAALARNDEQAKDGK